MWVVTRRATLLGAMYACCLFEQIPKIIMAEKTSRFDVEFIHFKKRGMIFWQFGEGFLFPFH